VPIASLPESLASISYSPVAGTREFPRPSHPLWWSAGFILRRIGSFPYILPASLILYMLSPCPDFPLNLKNFPRRILCVWAMKMLRSFFLLQTPLPRLSLLQGNISFKVRWSTLSRFFLPLSTKTHPRAFPSLFPRCPVLRCQDAGTSQRERRFSTLDFLVQRYATFSSFAGALPNSPRSLAPSLAEMTLQNPLPTAAAAPEKISAAS